MELIESKEEIWKKIDGYDTYSVSTIGRVRNDKRGGNILGGSVNSSGYLVVSLCKNGKKKDHYIHRLVAIAFIPNPENKPQVDHIFNNRTDNRVEVLRWCTNGENQMNAQIRTDNTSGVKGVTWFKRTQQWRVYIMVDGVLISLGYFDKIDDAINARQTRANEAFGVFTNLCETMDC